MCDDASQNKDYKVSDFVSCSIPSYTELSNAFHEKNVEVLSGFKKFSLQRKIILKLDE